MKNISRVIILLLSLCIFLSGCMDIVGTQESAIPAMTYNTVSVENIMLPFDSYYCEGKQYTDIVAQFENAGYTNVMAIEQKADNTKETRVNESVIAVSVNNNIIFSQGDLCTPDIEIKVYYVVSQITQDILSNESTVSQYKSYQDAVVLEQENKTSSETDTVNGATVWVTENGKKYHSKPTCSGMITPIEITVTDAEGQGYEPCKRCCQ